MTEAAPKTTLSALLLQYSFWAAIQNFCSSIKTSPSSLPVAHIGNAGRHCRLTPVKPSPSPSHQPKLTCRTARKGCEKTKPRPRRSIAALQARRHDNFRPGGIFLFALGMKRRVLSWTVVASGSVSVLRVLTVELAAG